ncbi:MAG TPA: hypothetical protein VHE61_08090 [Opitutaceae bacterium]|nr:hypothetical protein [Opitutaceae bacterium]
MRIVIPRVGRLLLFLAAIGVLRAEVPAVKEGASYDAGGYLLNNNVWGKKSSPTGWQVIDDIHAGPKLSWRVRYDWPVGSAPHGVKAYPSVITGWHWDLWSSDHRLPRTVSTLRHVLTGASVEIANPGVQNVAYDLWFHAAGVHPDKNKQPTDELMIWLDARGGAGPLGKYVATVTVGGAEWRLNVGDIGWKVFSFVRTVPSSSWDIDAKAFIDYLVAQGRMTPDKQLTSVEFGTEVFRTNGEGSFTVTDYFVTID